MDGRTWLAFWLAVLGNPADFLSIFFVCDSNSCILIKPSRVREKGQEILSLMLATNREQQQRRTRRDLWRELGERGLPLKD